MATLIRITAESSSFEAGGGQTNVATSLEVGRTLALLLLGVVFAIAALILFLADKESAASVFTGLVGLVLGAGFGLQQGERTGALEAEKVLRGA